MTNLNDEYVTVRVATVGVDTEVRRWYRRMRSEYGLSRDSAGLIAVGIAIGRGVGRVGLGSTRSTIAAWVAQEAPHTDGSPTG